MGEEGWVVMRDPEGMPVHLRIYMPIGDKNVFPAVVVVVQETDTKPKKRNTDRAEACRARPIVERAVPVIVIEIVRVVREIRFDQVWKTVVIVVAEIHTHSRLFAAVFAERHTGRYRNFRERFALIVVIEQTRGRIVRHINVRPSIAVVVPP